jgi:CRP-like cAMP-binding protein
VKLVYCDSLGNERIASFVWPGNFFGLDSVLEQGERQFSAVTRQPSQLARLDINYFKNIIASDSRLFFHILDRVCQSYVNTTLEKIEISGDRVRSRLQRVLRNLRQATFQQQTLGNANIGVVTQHELGQLLGVAEETISRELKKLQSTVPSGRAAAQPLSGPSPE